MRICYLVPGAMGQHPGGDDEVRRRRAYLAGRAPSGVIVELVDDPDGPPSVESPEDEREAARRVAVRAAELSGYDAIIVGCFGDPGLDAARRATTIPVVGPARAACEAAARRAPRFGVVTVVDEVVPLLVDLVDGYGLSRALVGVKAVNIPVRQLRARRDEALERAEKQAGEFVSSGAGAIVLGCMTMGFLGLAAELAERLDVPVVDPVGAALDAAARAGSPPLGQ